MGKHFGELMKLRGIITFKLSPHEQRAFAGAIKDGVPNTIRRIATEFPFLAIRNYLVNVETFNLSLIFISYLSFWHQLLGLRSDREGTHPTAQKESC